MGKPYLLTTLSVAAMTVALGLGAPSLAAAAEAEGVTTVNGVTTF